MNSLSSVRPIGSVTNFDCTSEGTSGDLKQYKRSKNRIKKNTMVPLKFLAKSPMV